MASQNIEPKLATWPPIGPEGVLLAGSSLRIFLDGKIRSEFDGQLLDVEGK